jgi:hypothetical protein
LSSSKLNQATSIKMPTIQKSSAYMRSALFFSALALSSFVSAHSIDTNFDQSKKSVPNSPAVWSAAEQNGIQMTYQETYDNHPGVYATQNPDFRKNV